MYICSQDFACLTEQDSSQQSSQALNVFAVEAVPNHSKLGCASLLVARLLDHTLKQGNAL